MKKKKLEKKIKNLENRISFQDSLFEELQSDLYSIRNKKNRIVGSILKRWNSQKLFVFFFCLYVVFEIFKYYQ